MIDYVVYGKIIIDNIKLLSGEIISEQLGGGGPQGAFGARVWDDSVGLVTRIGDNLPASVQEKLEEIQVDLEGVKQYEGLPTLQSSMFYDDNDYVNYSTEERKAMLASFRTNLSQLLSNDIELPLSYRTPKLIHLVTEFVDENMMIQALDMKKEGSILSLEPLVDIHQWTNKKQMIEFLPSVECISPDWPTACGFSGETEPLRVMKWWTKQGVNCVTLRDGRRGSYGWDALHDRIFHIPIIEVPRIDPTGCGNSYAGGTAVGWEKFKDVKIASAMGTVSATFMIQVPGIAFWEEDMKIQANLYLERLMDSIKEL